MLPFYPFYWADYSSKTFDLTMEQHGAYMLFLRHIYTTGQPIPHKHRFSIARALTEQQQENATIVLEKFFTLDGETWRNLRCEEVIFLQNEKHQRRVDAGRSGGIAKSTAKPKQPSSNARPKPEQSSSNQNQNQSIISSLRSEINISDDLWQDWKEHLKKKRAAPTPKREQLHLEKLKALTIETGKTAEYLVKLAIDRGWQSFFPERNFESTNKPKATHNNFQNQDYHAGTQGFIAE